jgi:hypothetical protein
LLRSIIARELVLELCARAKYWYQFSAITRVSLRRFYGTRKTDERSDRFSVKHSGAQWFLLLPRYAARSRTPSIDVDEIA